MTDPVPVSKEAKLAHIRKARRSELDNPPYFNAIVAEALKAGATSEEVEAALSEPR
jgi:hypothetical protein